MVSEQTLKFFLLTDVYVRMLQIFQYRIVPFNSQLVVLFYLSVTVSLHAQRNFAGRIRRILVDVYVKIWIWNLMKIFCQPKISPLQVRKDRPLILPLTVKIKYVLNANFNWKKCYLSNKIEMLIIMTIFNFFFKFQKILL